MARMNKRPGFRQPSLTASPFSSFPFAGYWFPRHSSDAKAHLLVSNTTQTTRHITPESRNQTSPRPDIRNTPRSASASPRSPYVFPDKAIGIPDRGRLYVQHIPRMPIAITILPAAVGFCLGGLEIGALHVQACSKSATFRVVQAYPHGSEIPGIGKCRQKHRNAARPHRRVRSSLQIRLSNYYNERAADNTQPEFQDASRAIRSIYVKCNVPWPLLPPMLTIRIINTAPQVLRWGVAPAARAAYPPLHPKANITAGVGSCTVNKQARSRTAPRTCLQVEQSGGAPYPQILTAPEQPNSPRRHSHFVRPEKG
ncbi:hypothetical protein BDW22DRAFT_1447116 [Trametopsis cervina]|nr:hypothetical protein BDW22DRAFT_1447116 [Trametopsis cervina]